MKFNSAAIQVAPVQERRRITRRRFLRAAGVTSGLLPFAWRTFAAAPAQTTAEEERRKIEKAIPVKALVPPRKPRKLLICDLNAGYGGHRSIPTANVALQLMGEKTGAFETVISRDPAVFKPSSLKQFDAVFFNNTVGNLFADPELRQSLVEFVFGGGGLLGVHGTSVAFTRWPGAIEDWPEFGVMLGARGANHRESDEHVFVKLDEPAHPLNRAFAGRDFEYRDEFFRVHGPYSRNRLRVLFSIDTIKTPRQGQDRGNCYREDNDYALAWIRQYGRGRVFYCTIAHNPYVFWDPQMLAFYLGAVQFALGDLPASATPSARLKPEIVAQERLGWRLGLPAELFSTWTLSEVIDKASELGLLYVGATELQGFRRHLPGEAETASSVDPFRDLRLKLDAAGVRLLTYHVRKPPSDPAGWRQLFERGRKLGVETFIAQAQPGELDILEPLCREFGISFALPGTNEKNAAASGPKEILKLCSGRSQWLGACGNVLSWIRAGVDPIEAVQALRDRLLVLEVHDVNERTPRGQEVPWGTGAGRLPQLLEELCRLGVRPVMFALDYRRFGANLNSELAENIKFFNKASLELAPRAVSS